MEQRWVLCSCGINRKALVWKEIFKDIIPKDNYQTQLINGEEKGLIVELIGNVHKVIINFGLVRALRMLEEGIVQKGVYSDDEISKYKAEEKHYVIITQNYNIDIMTEYIPSIEVLA